jgi:MFS family permease
MSLLRLMLKEEYRLHVSYSSARMFLAIPVFAFAVSLLMAVTIGNLRGTIGLADMITNLNAGVFLYGLSVGAFGFLGRTYVERRQGQQNFLVAVPALLPLSYRSTFLGMYLRDAIFYLLLMLGPAFLGLALAALIVNYSLLSVLAISSAMVLSFLFGLSLSFAVSVLGSRSGAVLAALVLIIFGLLVGYGVLHLYGLDAIIPSIGFQNALPPLGDDPGRAVVFLLSSLGLSIAFTAVAVFFVAESYEGDVRRKGPREDVLPSYHSRFAFARSYQALMAKEFVDLRRSGTVGKMTFTFIAPLTILSFTTWYVNNGLAVPVGFNTVFYAAMVGFFGVMLYSWLNNMDVVDYYETLPIGVPTVIRAKLFVFLLLTLGISTAFVLMIAFLNNETRLLWLALPVLYVTSVYMVAATSYLTGLHPNSFLFNPDVLFRFALVSILPDICLTILSFSVDRDPLIAIAGIGSVLGVLVAASFYFYRRLDRRWADAGFN